MDHQQRIKRLRRRMDSSGLDGLVYGIGANFTYFTGITPHWDRSGKAQAEGFGISAHNEPTRPACLFAMRVDREPIIIGNPYLLTQGEEPPFECEFTSGVAEVKDALESYFQGVRRFGTGHRASVYIRELLGDAFGDGVYTNAEELGQFMRLIKDADEVRRLTDLAGITDAAMEKVVQKIRPGVSQLELQEEIRSVGLKMGVDGTSFPPTAGFVNPKYSNEIEPFNYPKDEGLIEGTSIAFDFGYLRDGYCSDFGRSFYKGNAPEDYSGAYLALQAAQCQLIESIEPGQTRICDIFGIIEAALDERGYGDRIRARLSDGLVGHQIGIDLHEPPWINPSCDIALQPGMVMCVEPKVWLPGEYYYRVEDMILITEDGATSLTKFDRNLFEL